MQKCKNRKSKSPRNSGTQKYLRSVIFIHAIKTCFHPSTGRPVIATTPYEYAHGVCKAKTRCTEPDEQMRIK
jgi:hypothetical protein